ncbi:MAG: ferritin family protein [Candidatus Marinimicrobia bacterium]|nr:ferritin family protein [Candidatus Neomarinimicrobiota bacterium]
MERISLEEVFKIAIEIERNGQRFYRNYAEKNDDEKIKEVFNNLADMESDHERAFIEMKNRLVTDYDRIEADTEGLLNAYIKAFAGGYIFTSDDKIVEAGSPDDILKYAIGKEKDSISYYLAVKEFVVGEDNKDKVDRIIKEEMKHIIILSDLIASY